MAAHMTDHRVPHERAIGTSWHSSLIGLHDILSAMQWWFVLAARARKRLLDGGSHCPVFVESFYGIRNA
jgi:hypothetical protein